MPVQDVEAELHGARADRSKADAAADASASALKAAAAERDAARSTAADAERSAAAARQQAEAAQAESVALQRKLHAAEAAAAQLRQEAAGMRTQQAADAQRAAELQSALESAEAQKAAAERSLEAQAAKLELQAWEAAAAAGREQKRLQGEIEVLRRRAERQQQECARLAAALDKELRRGFWARLFGGGRARVAPEQAAWGSGAQEEAEAEVAATPPAAGNSWGSPRNQALLDVPCGTSPTDDAAAAGASGTALELLDVPGCAGADAEQGYPAFEEQLEQALADEATAVADEPPAGSEVLGRGGAAAKGGPASAPAMLPEDGAAAVSLKAQGATPGAAGAGAEAGGSMGAGGADAAAGGRESSSIPAFRPGSLEAAIRALL